MKKEYLKLKIYVNFLVADVITSSQQEIDVEDLFNSEEYNPW